MLLIGCIRFAHSRVPPAQSPSGRKTLPNLPPSSRPTRPIGHVHLNVRSKTSTQERNTMNDKRTESQLDAYSVSGSSPPEARITGRARVDAADERQEQARTSQRLRRVIGHVGVTAAADIEDPPYLRHSYQDNSEAWPGDRPTPLDRGVQEPSRVRAQLRGCEPRHEFRSEAGYFWDTAVSRPIRRRRTSTGSGDDDDPSDACADYVGRGSIDHERSLSVT